MGNDEDVQVETPPESNRPIYEFWITARDRNKALRVRNALAANAPGRSGKALRSTLIKAMPKQRKNVMLAVDPYGVPILAINLKSGEIAFVEVANDTGSNGSTPQCTENA